jgi:16S rRNA (adenine1518-N6/adenine1519-N6)-dimethyltransferase
MGARREAREALRAVGRRPRRRLGQHFLCDPSVVRRIVEAANVGPTDAVLEIGPGLGALTDALVERAGVVRLVEMDAVLAERLRERYAASSHVRVVTGDVVALDPRAFWGDVSRPGTVVANLPYNVSTPVLFRLLDWSATFPRAVLMVQREVASRLVAGPGTAERGILSVLVQARATVRICFDVGPRSFHPPPRVRSTVIDVRRSPTPAVPPDEWEAFRTVVRAAFGKRRKMLRGALRDVVAPGGRPAAGAIEAALAAAGVDPTARAETLPIDAFLRIARALGVP